MNCVYDIYMKGNVMQCFGMGHFIVYPKKHFSTSKFFQENSSIYFEYYFSICYLIFTISCGYLVVVKMQPWSSALYWIYAERSLCHQLRSLYWRPGNCPDHRAAAAVPCSVQEQWPPQKNMRAVAVPAELPLWFICKMVLYSMGRGHESMYGPKLLLCLYIFKILHSTALMDSHSPSFLPASPLSACQMTRSKEERGYVSFG